MTVDEMRALERPTITPKEAAEVLGCAPYYFNVAARQQGLPFDFYFSGRRLHIMRISFLNFVDGKAR